MGSGQLYRCQNPNCRKVAVLQVDSTKQKSNPRCSCGSEMKRPYSKPQVRVLRLETLPVSSHENDTEE